MENHLKTGTEKILTIMYVLTWVAFVGLMIEWGAILVSYGVSCINPGFPGKLYRELNLSDLRQSNFWYYTGIVSFMVAISGMKAFVVYLLIGVLSKVNMANPFTIEVARTIEKISGVLFGIWIITMAYNAHAQWLEIRTGIMQEERSPGEYVFMAGIVFILSQIFKRGVEIQTENDLTV